jgi:hypothetical protein
LQSGKAIAVAHTVTAERRSGQAKMADQANTQVRTRRIGLVPAGVVATVGPAIAVVVMTNGGRRDRSAAPPPVLPNGGIIAIDAP